MRTIIGNNLEWFSTSIYLSLFRQPITFFFGGMRIQLLPCLFEDGVAKNSTVNFQNFYKMLTMGTYSYTIYSLFCNGIAPRFKKSYIYVYEPYHLYSIHRHIGSVPTCGSSTHPFNFFMITHTVFKLHVRYII